MKKIICVFLCVMLSGCFTAGDLYLCDDCFSNPEKRNTVVESLIEKYPENSQVVDIMNNGEIYTVKKHTRHYNGVFNDMFDGPIMFIGHIILLPIELPISLFYPIGFPVDYEYGMDLENKKGEEKFVAYYSIKGVNPDNTDIQKKYSFVTTQEYTQIKATEAAAKAAEVAAKKAEEEKQLKLQKQEEARQKDCTQAKNKAKAKEEEFNSMWGEGTNWKILSGEVFDFPVGGLMIKDEIGFFDTNLIYVSTLDTDYATGENWSSKGIIYRRNGNYRYTTISGGTNSIPKYISTGKNISEIHYETYLQDKSHECD